MDQERLKERLTPEEYEVTQHGATEKPFTGKYNDFYEKGLYVDVVDGNPLFVSNDKFHSGCGWPAFSKPIDEEALYGVEDRSHGMQRIEVRSQKANSHLGHVFHDGPKELGGLRFCINSAALRFIPLSEMEKKGYGKYIPYIK